MADLIQINNERKCHNMSFIEIAAKAVPILTFVGGVIGAAVKVGKEYSKIRNAQKCQLRADMLRTYYHNKNRKKIRQYEKQNFIYSYEAYKALKGNSFIDDVHDDVMSWEMET